VDPFMKPMDDNDKFEKSFLRVIKSALIIAIPIGIILWVIIIWGIIELVSWVTSK
jgi:hypothetical protein